MLTIPTTNQHAGRLAAVELAVLHTAQAPCRSGVAEAVMRYLARPEVRSSAHYCCDPATTVAGAKAATAVRRTIGGRIPQPVDTDGRTPALWADCTAYIVDEDDKATVDDQDLIAAIDAAPGKLRPTDDNPAKIKARLAAEVAKAKADREAGKPVGREKPAAKVEQPVRGGAVRAPR